MYLVYVLLGSFACAAIEMKHRKSVLAAMGRVVLTLVQGVWFITVGWILYPPPGSPVWGKGPEHVMHDEIMIVSSFKYTHIYSLLDFTEFSNSWPLDNGNCHSFNFHKVQL